jgi:hypothetical protein
MRRLVLPLALLAAIVVALGLAWSQLHGGAADGERVAAQSIAVGEFRHVEVNGHADVVLVQGDAEAVDVEASPKRHARVRIRSEGGTLKISSGEDSRWWAGLPGGGARPPRITIHFRQLESLALSGALRLSADGVKATRLVVRASGAASVRMEGIDAAALRFVGSGAVKVEMAGRAAEQEVSISGAGAYRAPRLASEHAEVKVSGAGRVVVNASRSLEASISGAGAIDYHGNPQVRQRISGAGRIRQVTDADTPQRAIVVVRAATSAADLSELLMRPASSRA